MSKSDDSTHTYVIRGVSPRIQLTYFEADGREQSIGWRVTYKDVLSLMRKHREAHHPTKVVHVFRRQG